MAETNHAHAEEFAGAARRHFDDAEYLRVDHRLPNADYHYGFAVECALKSLLLRYLGAGLDKKNKPKYGSDSLGHMPAIWKDARTIAQGRSATKLVAAMAGEDHFDGYQVAHRYLSTPPVSAEELQNRRGVAYRILALHEQSLIIGGLR